MVHEVDSFMSQHDFNKASSDDCVFVRRFSNCDFVIALLFVEDL